MVFVLVHHLVQCTLLRCGLWEQMVLNLHLRRLVGLRRCPRKMYLEWPRPPPVCYRLTQRLGNHRLMPLVLTVLLQCLCQHQHLQEEVSREQVPLAHQ